MRELRLAAFRGYRIDAEAGVVYGKRGLPIGCIKRDGFLESHGSGVGYFRLNRLVWWFVNGPIPEWMDVLPINGIKTDNRISNLKLVTLSEIGLCSYERGARTAKGQANGRALLNERDVLEIRASTISSGILSKRYGVSKRTIRDARVGRTWSLTAP